MRSKGKSQWMFSHMVFDAIRPSSERIVFQIENLKAGVEILDESSNGQGALVIPKRDRVDRQPSLARIKIRDQGPSERKK